MSSQLRKQRNRIIFRSAWLDQAAKSRQHDDVQAVVALCDELLNDLKSRIGVAERFARSCSGNSPTLRASPQ